MNKSEMRRKAIENSMRLESLRLANVRRDTIGFMTGTPATYCLTCGFEPPCQCPPVRTTLREQLAKALKG